MLVMQSIISFFESRQDRKLKSLQGKFDDRFGDEAISAPIDRSWSQTGPHIVDDEDEKLLEQYGGDLMPFARVGVSLPAVKHDIPHDPRLLPRAVDDIDHRSRGRSVTRAHARNPSVPPIPVSRHYSVASDPGPTAPEPIVVFKPISEEYMKSLDEMGRPKPDSPFEEDEPPRGRDSHRGRQTPAYETPVHSPPILSPDDLNSPSSTSSSQRSSPRMPRSRRSPSVAHIDPMSSVKNRPPTPFAGLIRSKSTPPAAMTQDGMPRRHSGSKTKPKSSTVEVIFEPVGPQSLVPSSEDLYG